jgi:DNA-binding MarR family transcriptional regulator
MENARFDLIIDNIFSLKPILTKKLVNPSQVTSEYSNGSIYIMIILEKYKSLSMSEIGKLLSIPRPNVTSMIDKMISMDIVERLRNEKDRRMIFIKLTDKGTDYINNFKKSMREKIKEKLMILTDEDLNQLYDSLINVNRILLKIADAG